MAVHDKKDRVLAGDIGGTKTDLAVFTRGTGRPALMELETYASGDAPDPESLIERFLEKRSLSIQDACFGIAGPVENGRCKTTNLPWVVYEDRIQKRFKWKQVRLINDLTAMALAIPYLKRKEVYELTEVKGRKGQNIALIAPGTGLGQALLVFHEKRYIPIASEGGHTDFPLNKEEHIGLWRHLQQRYGHVSIERILSGPGIHHIYSWLKESGGYREPKWLSTKIGESDPARVITEAALDRGQPLCSKTLDIFVPILGAAAGNLALTGTATGGVYLGGGIPPKILPKLEGDLFLESFRDKGRFREFMEKIPVRVILYDKPALLGAAVCAFARKGGSRNQP